MYVCMYVFSVVMYNYEAEMAVSESEYITGAVDFNKLSLNLSMSLSLRTCVYALCDSVFVCMYVCVCMNLLVYIPRIQACMHDTYICVCMSIDPLQIQGDACKPFECAYVYLVLCI